MSLSLSVHDGVRAIPAAEWDALVPGDDPFLEHAFLALLEESGAVGQSWVPRPLTARRDGKLVGAAPLYLRGDSYGEYIFDWAWAQGARRAGIPYYPKLTAAVPFTPATGERLLAEDAEVRQGLAAAAVQVGAELGASSLHWLFVPGYQSDELASWGMVPRLSYQFHWVSRGWPAFEYFLAAMKQKRRKEVLRERRQAREGGVEIRVLRGEEMESADWRAMHQFYRSTIASHGAIPYLVDRFWELAPTRIGHRVVTAMAFRAGKRIAGAFNLTRGANLYGRYWGAIEEHRALHFEVCYYALIEWAIANGITRFEAGAQGEHKLQRGFLPALTHSAHHAFHPGLRDAIARFCAAEGEHVRAEVEELGRGGPFA